MPTPVDELVKRLTMCSGVELDRVAREAAAVLRHLSAPVSEEEVEAALRLHQDGKRTLSHTIRAALDAFLAGRMG